MDAVLAASSYSRGCFSLCLAVSARHFIVPGGSMFHLEPGTIELSCMCIFIINICICMYMYSTYILTKYRARKSCMMRSFLFNIQNKRFHDIIIYLVQ